MSVTGWLLGFEKRAAEMSALRSMASQAPSVSGVAVTADVALRNMTVLACIRIISQALASVPLLLYRQQGRNRTRAVEHPVYDILQRVGNSEMTAYEVREARLAHTMAWGNAYAEIQYDANYNIIGLWPLAPDRVGVERNAAGRLIYTYWSDAMGRGFELPSYRVMHTRYLILRGVIGMSPIRQAMNAIGLSAAAEEFGGRYFANGSRPSIILKHPGKISSDVYLRLRESFSQNWQGLENAHRINILEEGITPETIGIPPEEAQFIQTREYGVAEVARLYGVPLHMLAAGQSATFASSEQDAINFRQFTLLEWAKRDEQRINMDLLTKAERRDGYYAEYLLDGLERATIETRTTAYSTMIQTGVMMPNEARERENLDPVAGGDVLLLPLNMQQVRPDGTIVSSSTQTNSDRSPHAWTEDELDSLEKAQDERLERYRNAIDKGVPTINDMIERDVTPDCLDPLIADVRTRVINLVTNDVRQGGAKALRIGGRAGLAEWIEGQYADWRLAAGRMLVASEATAQRLGITFDVDPGAWIDQAVTAGVAQLIGGGS